jgi:uncharacterized protein YggU (UPF0235/DUF167 family)
VNRPYRAAPDGLILHVRVTPNAGADRIDGVERLDLATAGREGQSTNRRLRDDGTTVLRVRVTAVPDKGKANAAVIALLAKALAIPKSAVTLTAGETSRLKTLHLGGDPVRLAAAIDALETR